jgi:hypothetical protein
VLISTISKRGLLFVGAVVATSLVSFPLFLDSNLHAAFIFLCLFYFLALPALLWWFRKEPENSIQSASVVPDLRAVVIVAFGVGAAVLGSTYDHGHTITDESAYRFQARIFAAGRLKADPMPGATSNPAAAPTEIFIEHHVHSDRGWFSKYPPGWPLLLMLGYLARCPWMVNPLLGVLLLLLVNQVARPWGAETQKIAVLITGVSAYTLLYSIGFMSHGFAAVVAAASLAAAVHGVRTKRLRSIAICFLLVVLGIEIRPYTGAIVALLCAGYTLSQFRGKRVIFWQSFAVMTGAAVLAVALFLVANKLYTGNLLISPYAYAHGGTKITEVTFDPNIIGNNIVKFWRWDVTATLCSTFPFVFVAAIYACIQEGKFRRELVFLALLFPSLMLAYIFQVKPSGSFDGERFWFEGYGPECVVAARGALLLWDRWRVRVPVARLALAILVGVHLAFVGFMVRDVEAILSPWRKMYQASIERPAPSLVFLSVSQGDVWSKHTNWNQVDWQKAPTIYLNDPGTIFRDEVACRFHRASYRVVSFDLLTDEPLAQNFVAQCAAD